MTKYFLLAAFGAGGFLSAQTPTSVSTSPTTGCTAEIRGQRPKIYIANFLVTYGKKDMGQAIGDLIAQKFEADGRFEMIPRAGIHAEMQPALKKNLKAEKYLSMTVALAAEKGADCVIFGRISKKKGQVSFLVRMASVATGENLRKVDTDVERDRALSFLENIGDSFVSFFTTTAQPVIAETDNNANSHRGFYLNLVGGAGYLSASKPIGSDSFSVDSAAGHAGAKIGGAVRPDVIFFASFDSFWGFNSAGKVTPSGPADTVGVTGITHSIVMAGAGLTVYGDANYFFSATLGAATGILGYNYGSTAVSGSSGVGFGLNLSMGREWLVAKRFGIGAAIIGHYSNIPDGSISTNQYYAGLALTATYN